MKQEPFNDASFIMGLNCHSEYDKYFYVNNYSDFSYLYTDFSVNYDNSFNVNKPEIEYIQFPMMLLIKMRQERFSIDIY